MSPISSPQSEAREYTAEQLLEIDDEQLDTFMKSCQDERGWIDFGNVSGFSTLPKLQRDILFKRLA